MVTDIQKMVVVFGMLVSFTACNPSTGLQPGEICQEETQVYLIEQGPTERTQQLKTYHPNDHHRAIMRCGRRAVNNTTFYQEVYIYQSLEAAQREYNRQLGIMFKEDEYTSAWEAPEQFSLTDLGAQQAHLACAESGGSELCKFLAQYQTIVVRMNINRILSGMSIEEFVSAAVDADQTISSALDETD